MSDYDLALLVSSVAIAIAFLGTIAVPYLTHRNTLKMRNLEGKVEYYGQKFKWFKLAQSFLKATERWVPADAKPDDHFIQACQGGPDSPAFKNVLNAWMKTMDMDANTLPFEIFVTNQEIKAIWNAHMDKYPGFPLDTRVKDIKALIEDLDQLLKAVKPLIQKECKVT